MDELFYIRAWNEPFIEYTGHFAPSLTEGINGIRMALEVGARSEPMAEQSRVKKIVGQMWMWTAHVAATPAYSALVADLLTNERFAEEWEALIVDEGAAILPMEMPVLRDESDEGPFSVQLGELLFPPLYRLFIWQSGFEGGTSGPRLQTPKVFFADHVHWSL